MIVFLLLVVIAILLFGSSAIIGAIGMFLGVMAGFGALVALALWLGFDPWIFVIVCLVLLAVWGFWFENFTDAGKASVVERRAKEQAKRDRPKG